MLLLSGKVSLQLEPDEMGLSQSGRAGQGVHVLSKGEHSPELGFPCPKTSTAVAVSTH